MTHESSKQRDEYVDVAKGFCMLLVICIHSEVFGVIGMPVTFIAVPMFFFLSGFYDRSERSVKSWIVHPFKSLIVPGVIWLIVGLCYLALLSYINRGSYTITNTLYDPFVGNGAVWFLFALFYAKVMLGVLLRFRLPKWCVLILCVGIGCLSPLQQLPLCLDKGLAALPLYYIGKISYPYIRQTVVRIIPNLLGIAALALFLFHQLTFWIGIYKPNYIVALAAVILVFCPVLYCCKLAERCAWLANFGRRSLGIMLTHMLMCHTVAVTLNRIFEKGSLVWIVAFLIAYVAVCFAAYWLTVCVERFCPVLLGRM